MQTRNHNLFQVVYCSAATPAFTPAEVENLLRVARRRNAHLGITGMLLYAGRSFIQVIEGKRDDVDRLIKSIEKDERHRDITVIIREPIAERAFGDWTMGYADLRAVDDEEVVGINDFLQRNEPLSTLGQGRARKLLDLFKQGHWRSKISDHESPGTSSCRYRLKTAFPPASADKPAGNTSYSFAFQPIVDVSNCSIISYEALLRGAQDESAQEVLHRVKPPDRPAFNDDSRRLAIRWAAHLGLCTRLNLNILPSAVLASPSEVVATLEAAARVRLQPQQIVLEILESEIVDSLSGLSTALREFRRTGLRFAIDDFGAGYAGLNLLAEFQPDILKLDIRLVRNVERKGPRQAIIRGILRTCTDLGVEVVAEGVETEREFRWLRDAGIKLFQGYLFARPALEKLPHSFYGPA